MSLTIIRLNAVRQKIPFSVTVGKNVGVILVACLLGYFSSLPALKSYYDATENKRNTLTETSQKIMAQLTGGLTVTSYINVLDPDAAWYLMELFLSRDKERYERYQRFKPEMKLKYVYYYDRTYNPTITQRYPGLSDEEILEKLSMSRLELTLSGSNLFTICSKKLRGQTPTQGGFSEVQLSDRPTYSLTLNVSF